MDGIGAPPEPFVSLRLSLSSFTSPGFPPYPKLLGDMIAINANQFFVTTHNPYLLLALAEKTPKTELGIFVCSRDDEGATHARLLTDEQVAEVIEESVSVFFNLDHFLES